MVSASSSEQGRIDDALNRLVCTISSDDQLNLARRLLESNIATSTRTNDKESPERRMAGCWRRVARKYPSSLKSVQADYQRLERYSQDELNNDVPAKSLMVLTKLMGKQIVTASSKTKQHSKQTHDYKLKPIFTTTINKAVLEEEIRQEKQVLQEEEALLLRECLYSLQGIHGERIQFNPQKQVCVTSSAIGNPMLYTGRSTETRLGSGSATALKQCGEAGFLYSQILTFIQDVQQEHDTNGVIARAFAGTLSEELREYHSLLTKYESKLNQLSLRQLLVDLRQPTNRLRILALITDSLKQYSGGQLLTGLVQHSTHGDSRHASLVKSVLGQVSQPWWDMLYRWTTQGLLVDPHDEFFITCQDDVDDKHLWKSKFTLNESQIPFGLLEKSLVLPCLTVGKGINFIRKCLLDGKWTMKQQLVMNNDSNRESSSHELGFSYHSCQNLETTLEKANALVHSHILTCLKQDNHLLDHLFALKQFLFLGQGDFFSALVEGLFHEFHLQPNQTIYKHSLLSIVEGALRSTNAKYLPSYVLDRLQVELVIHENNNNDNPLPEQTVWDSFLLDYQVPDPLLAIIHPKEQLDQYKLVFSLLFRIKKIEFLLNYTWRQSATLQHALSTTAQYNGITVSTNANYTTACALLRKISILRQSMMHLIINLKSYLMFEVLEGGWLVLEKSIQTAKTLDQVIEAHDNYLSSIVTKSFIRQDQQQQQQGPHILSLLEIATQFCHLQEALFRDALLKADLATQQRLEAELLQRQGQWGFADSHDTSNLDDFFGLSNMDIFKQVEQISQVYNHQAILLLQVLGNVVNGGTIEDDEDVYSHIPNGDLDPQRFLMAQLDHNQYYASQQQRQEQAAM